MVGAPKKKRATTSQKTTSASGTHTQATVFPVQSVKASMSVMTL